MSNSLHVEVLLKEGYVKTDKLQDEIKAVLEPLENPLKDFCVHNHSNLTAWVDSITLSSYTRTFKTCVVGKDMLLERKCHEYSDAMAPSFKDKQFYLYNHDGGANKRRIDEIALADEKDTTSQHYRLPCRKFQDTWDTLVIDQGIKTQLLDYIKTGFLYAKNKVNGSVISWNKVILLHGPPGSGKTSLCQALAQKAAIRFGHDFSNIHLIQLNGHNIFASDSQDSTKLIQKTFEKVHDMANNDRSLVFLQIDNIESLATNRMPRGHGSESGNILRAIGCVLVELDSLKRYDNLMVLTTTSMIGSLDIGFVDRSDFKLFISYPAAELIYELYAASVNELLRVGMIFSEDNMSLPPRVSIIQHSHDSKTYELAQQLLQVSKSGINLSARTLKRMPFVTQARYIQGSPCPVEYFMDKMKYEIEMEKQGLIDLEQKCRSAFPQYHFFSGPQPQIVAEIEKQHDTPSSVIRPVPSSQSTVAGDPKPTSAGRGRPASRAGKRRRGSSTRTMQTTRELESDELENGRRLRNTKVIPLVNSDEIDEEEERVDNNNRAPSPPSKKSRINRQVDIQNSKVLNLVPRKSHNNNDNTTTTTTNNNNNKSGNTLDTTSMSSSSKSNLPNKSVTINPSPLAPPVIDYKEQTLTRLYRLRTCFIDLTKSTCTSEGVLIDFQSRKKTKTEDDKKVQDSTIPTINLNQESNQVPLDLESTTINTIKCESQDNSDIGKNNSTTIAFASSSTSTPSIPSTSSHMVENTNIKFPSKSKLSPTKNVPSSQVESLKLSTTTSHSSSINNNVPLKDKLVETSTSSSSSSSSTSLTNTSNKLTASTTIVKVNSSVPTASSSSATPSIPSTKQTYSQNTNSSSSKSIPPNQQQLPSKESTKPVKLPLSKISPPSTKIANNFVQLSSTPTPNTTASATTTTTTSTTTTTNTAQQSSIVQGHKLKIERLDSKVNSNSLNNNKLTLTPNSKTLVDIKVEQTTSKNNYNTPKRTQNSNDVKPIMSRLAVVGTPTSSSNRLTGTPTSSSNRLSVTPNNNKTGTVIIPKRKQQFNVNSTANTPVLIESRNKTPILQSKKIENNNNNNSPIVNGFHPQNSLKKVNPKMERRRTISHSSIEEAEVITLSDSDNEETPKRRRILDRADIKRAESATITILHPESNTNGTQNQIGTVGLTCQVCHIVFQNKKELTNHQRTLHENPHKVRCRKCKRTFINDKNLDRHKDKCKMKDIATPPPSPLPNVVNGLSHPSPNQNSTYSNFNGKLTPGNKKLTSANNSSSPKIPVIGTSVSPESVSSKKGSPTGKKQGHIIQSDQFKCLLCGQCYTTEVALKFHVSQSHDQIPSEQISCSVCGNLFGSEAEVEEHEAASHRNLNSPNLESDGFPGTPFSQATTELSSVSSYNNSDCDPLAYTPSSMMDEYEFSGTGFQNNGSLLATNTSTEDLPMDRTYQNCQVCGECVFTNEMNQHCTLRHPNQQQQQQLSLSTNNTGTCHDEFQYLDVPVPDVENIIEVETTDEFLTFLNAF